mgnify:CR=1 FL=1
MRLNGRTGWGPTFGLSGPYSGVVAIPVIQSVLSDGDPSTPQAVALVSISLQEIHSRLQALPTGASGVVLFMASNGEILSSSLTALEQYRRSSGPQIYYNSSIVQSNAVLNGMMEQLVRWRLINPFVEDWSQFEACQSRKPGLDDEVPCSVMSRTLTLNERSYELLATPLTTPGVQWFVAIAILKSEFDGGLSLKFEKQSPLVASFLGWQLRSLC